MMIYAGRILGGCLDILAFFSQFSCFLFLLTNLPFRPTVELGKHFTCAAYRAPIEGNKYLTNKQNAQEFAQGTRVGLGSGWGRQRERERGGERVGRREWREEDLLSIVHVQFLCEFVKIDTAIRAA